MKKLLTLILCFTLLAAISLGCERTPKAPVYEFSPEELNELIDPDFADEPYEYVEEGSELTTSELKAIISKVPTDKYDDDPSLHNVPRTATLYKNGEITFIEPKDPRLIGLVNLYNNSVYNSQYSYSQGLVNAEFVKEVENEEFRLVLTYTPDIPKDNKGYENSQYDTIIITNKYVTLLAHDLPGYEDNEKDYPFRAICHIPLHSQYPWLDLFGF